MENLEIKGVRTPEDIKNVYLKAVEQNAKYYRAVSNSGKFYGWETSLAYPQGHHIPAQVGQEWFVNDKYVEPVEVAKENLATELIEEPIEEVAENEPISEPEVEPVVEVEQPMEETVEEPAEIDYKALYEETLEKLGEVEDKLANKDEEISALKAEIEKISTEYANYKAEIETVKKFFRG